MPSQPNNASVAFYFNTIFDINNELVCTIDYNVSSTSPTASGGILFGLVPYYHVAPDGVSNGAGLGYSSVSGVPTTGIWDALYGVGVDFSGAYSSVNTGTGGLSSLNPNSIALRGKESDGYPLLAYSGDISQDATPFNLSNQTEAVKRIRIKVGNFGNLVTVETKHPTETVFVTRLNYFGIQNLPRYVRAYVAFTPADDQLNIQVYNVSLNGYDTTLNYTYSGACYLGLTPNPATLTEGQQLSVVNAYPGSYSQSFSGLGPLISINSPDATAGAPYIADNHSITQRFAVDRPATPDDSFIFLNYPGFFPTPCPDVPTAPDPATLVCTSTSYSAVGMPSSTTEMIFSPRFWVCDFDGSTRASLTTGPSALYVTASFTQTDGYAGVAWYGIDKYSHPYLKHNPVNDYTGVSLLLHYKQIGEWNGLDSVNPNSLVVTLSDDTLRYVRLWNYVTFNRFFIPTPNEADILLNFDALSAGWFNDTRLNPKNIKSISFGVSPSAYNVSLSDPLDHITDLQLQITDMTCSKNMRVGNVTLPQNGFNICTAYDDMYNLSPELIVNHIINLGYGPQVTHYFGCTHFYPLTAIGAGVSNVRLLPTVPTCPASDAWHRDLITRIINSGRTVTLSQSFELYTPTLPIYWDQQDYANNPARTGWVPSTTLVRFMRTDVRNYLSAVAVKFCSLVPDYGRVRYQIGEPWWWFNPGTSAPCIYDNDTRVAYNAAYPTRYASDGGFMTTIYTTPNSAQQFYLSYLRDQLGVVTGYLRNAVKANCPGIKAGVLFYAPSVFNNSIMQTVNYPKSYWQYPNYDFFQLEDYDWVAPAILPAHYDNTLALGVCASQLAYPLSGLEYFSGFALSAIDWCPITRVASEVYSSGVSQVYLWSLVQVIRDGYVAPNQINYTMNL